MISSIVELEVLSPLFIKGKDVEYGEGFIPVNKKVYLIDNDKLCKFIGEKTYDENGLRRYSTPDYIDWYGRFIQGPSNLDGMVDHYNSFAQAFGKQTVDTITSVPKEYKDKSIDFFLKETKLIPEYETGRETIIKEKLAKGVTSLSKSSSKEFVQNGRGVNYIPGSTIKGAIRNAVLWQIMCDTEKKALLTSFVRSNLDQVNLLFGDRKREFVNKFSNQVVNGITLQSMSFTEITPALNSDVQVICDSFNTHWRAANEVLKDFFRVVKVSDANFTAKPTLCDKKIGIFCRNGVPPDSTISLKTNNRGRPLIDELLSIVEAVKARFKITIDDKLAAEFFPQGVPDFLKSVDKLLKIVNDFFAAVADEEQIFYGSVDAAYHVKDVQNFYNTLFPPVNGACRLRIGWGGGMKSKTQFLHLDEPTRSDVRNLIMSRGTQVAPKSRCLLIDDHNRPLKPLGWCELRLLTGTEATYIGIDAYKQRTGEIPTIAQPPGSVRALIINDGQPVIVRVLEGNFMDKEIKMPKIHLKNLGLAIGSEVFIKLIVQRQQIVSIEYRGKA